MTKADVLDAFEELHVCTDYSIQGKTSREVPFQMDKKLPEAIYHPLKGWHTDTSQIRSYEALPPTTRTYVDFINEYLGVKIHYISNGPGRDQIVVVP